MKLKFYFLSMLMACATMTFVACGDDDDDEAPTKEQKGGSQGGGQQGGGTAEAKGDGSLTNPFNAVAATQEASKLDADQVSEKEYYIKGKVASIKENFDNTGEKSAGTATLYISDDGKDENTFYLYRIYYLNNKKWAQGDGDLLKVGDEIIVCCKLQNYKGNTPENKFGYLYSLNGKASDNGQQGNTAEPKGDGSLDNPFNAAAACAEALKLENKAVSEASYYIKGKVAKIDKKDGEDLNYNQGTFGNATFYISDDGNDANTFYCYRVLYLGNKKWVEGAGEILQVGDEVIIYGQLTNYNGTPETAQGKSYLYSLNGVTEAGETGEGGGGLIPTGENLLTNADFEGWVNNLPADWQSTSSASKATLEQSTDAHNGSYSVLIKSASSNQRMAYKEIKLKAGSYRFSFYAKTATAESAQTKGGYVPIKEDGTPGSYKYADNYTNLSNTAWTEVAYTFTLTADTEVCLLVMNPKSTDSYTAQDILVDDASLVTSDGGLVE